MTSPVPVAFYAPLKSPEHPDPSGDRTVARLMLSALRLAGFAPSLASGLRTFEPRGDAAVQAGIRRESAVEAGRIVATWAGLPTAERPRLWFTYHCYYKAPDHLGPAVARQLGLPYVVAEASRSGKRAGGAWAIGHAAAEAAIAAAAAILVLTGHDREALAADPASAARLVDLPPFVDVSPGPATERARYRADGPVRLLAVAMMRAGDKLASYRLLARSLACIAHLDWTLAIAGDGPARPEVEAAFASLAGRVRWHGRLDGAALRSLYGEADLFVWPAVNEAYGMALIEAQAAGCPVVAGRYGGVSDALVPDRTGLLAPRGDAEAFAAAVALLIADPAQRSAMGRQAARFVREERNVGRAAATLRATLIPLVTRAEAA